MDTLQRLRANLESTQEPDPLLADCFREIESLLQQNASQLAELEAISAALGTSEGHSSVTHILDLRQQLADHIKREVMLRDALAYVISDLKLRADLNEDDPGVIELGDGALQQAEEALTATKPKP